MKHLSILFLLAFLAGCGNGQEQATTEQNLPTDPYEQLEMAQLAASRLRGGGFVSDVQVKDGNMKVEYVSTFEEYKELQPQSNLTEADWLNYWGTNDAIWKALVFGVDRLYKKLPFINRLMINIPFKGVIFTISTTRSDWNAFKETADIDKEYMPFAVKFAAEAIVHDKN